MPFIERGSDGKILTLHRHAQANAQEFLSPTDPQVLDFINEDHDEAKSKWTLAESDGYIARVTEDLIHLLISKKVILFKELPEPVQHKLLAREKLRSCLNFSAYNTIQDDED